MGEKIRHDPEARGGGLSWLVIGATVVALECRRETLSNAFARGREHENPLIRAATVGGLAVIGAHLMDVLPEDYDPVDRIADRIGRVRGRVEDWATEGIRIP